MSTLGRKAMKKTLEELKENASRDTKDCFKLFEKGMKASDRMKKDMRTKFLLIMDRASTAIASLMTYTQALEDYGYELDEEWDKLLKRAEAQQSKPMQKKEEAKKTSYIK